MPAFYHEQPDLVILDILLPYQNGWEICRQIRREFSAPTIMLTEQGEETDRIVGLELGADDYIPKPFSPHEMVTGICAVFHRTQGRQIKNRVSLISLHLTFTQSSYSLDKIAI